MTPRTGSLRSVEWSGESARSASSESDLHQIVESVLSDELRLRALPSAGSSSAGASAGYAIFAGKSSSIHRRAGRPSAVRYACETAPAALRADGRPATARARSPPSRGRTDPPRPPESASADCSHRSAAPGRPSPTDSSRAPHRASTARPALPAARKPPRDFPQTGGW